MRHEYDNLKGKALFKKNIFFGEVISNNDPHMMGKIFVRIEALDKNTPNNLLPPCYPLKDPFIIYTPKVGERVYVELERTFNSVNTTNQDKRYWRSLSLSELNKFDYDPYYYTASSHESNGWIERGTPISEISAARGVFPLVTSLSIRGRNNSDIIFNDEELLLRAGFHKSGKPYQFNNENPSYIQMKLGGKKTTDNQTTIVPKFEYIQPEYIISVSEVDLEVTSKVFKNGDVVETIINTFENRNDLSIETKITIKLLQNKYGKWQLRTFIPELKGLPLIFPNNKSVKYEKRVKNETTDINSTINFVSTKFNFISHTNIQQINTTTPNEYIDSENLSQINELGEPIVYGNKIVDLLKLFQDFVRSHVHQYPKMPPVQTSTEKKILNFDLESILNKNMKTL